MVKIAVQTADFDLATEIRELRGTRTDSGAMVSFVGLVRDFHGNQPIEQMTIEHFPGMAEDQLQALYTAAAARWPLQDGVVIHRYGSLVPGDQIVLVITLSAHRDAAFAAAEYMMDGLKTGAPFWKKEKTAAGEHWVRATTADQDRKDRWD